LVIESMRNKQNFNISRTAEQLDDIIDRIKHRYIFVVNKESDFYQVLDYRTKKIMINYLPTRGIAEKITEKYNDKITYSESKKEKIAHAVKEFLKLHADIQHYSNIIHHSHDPDSIETNLIRLQDAEIKKLHVIDLLERMI
jgi:sugar-specific transcriptional regulator TrmB